MRARKDQSKKRPKQEKTKARKDQSKKRPKQEKTKARRQAEEEENCFEFW
jgi:hypothetical protein